MGRECARVGACCCVERVRSRAGANAQNQRALTESRSPGLRGLRLPDLRAMTAWQPCVTSAAVYVLTFVDVRWL